MCDPSVVIFETIRLLFRRLDALSPHEIDEHDDVLGAIISLMPVYVKLAEHE